MKKVLLAGLTVLFAMSGYIAFAGTNDPPSCAISCTKGYKSAYCPKGQSCAAYCDAAGYPVVTPCK